MAKVSVIGAGSWGTALALLLYKNGHDVTVWSYQEEEVRMLSEKREHVSKLPGVKIPDGIFFTADIKEAVEEKDVVVLAVPSIHVRNTAKKINPYLWKTSSACRGWTRPEKMSCRWNPRICTRSVKTSGAICPRALRIRR